SALTTALIASDGSAGCARMTSAGPARARASRGAANRVLMVPTLFVTIGAAAALYRRACLSGRLFGARRGLRGAARGGPASPGAATRYPAARTDVWLRRPGCGGRRPPAAGVRVADDRHGLAAR